MEEKKLMRMNASSRGVEGKPLSECSKEELLTLCGGLLGILDDIDTASDIFKADYRSLAKYTYKKHQERWSMGVSSDGYEYHYSSKPDNPQPHDK